MDMDRLSHAYLISGEAEEGYGLARKLAAAMLCTAPGGKPCGHCRDCRKSLRDVHPDITVIERKGDDKGKKKREIYVEQVREIVQSALILPNEAACKVYVIRDAGTMNPNAQNALLKLLEEPPKFVRFILLADNAAELLETVRSRCVALHVRDAAGGADARMRTLAEQYLDAAARRSRIALLSFLTANGELSTQEATDFVLAVRERLVDMLAGRLSAQGLARSELRRLCALMEQAREYLRFNVSVKHLFGLLSADTIQ